ncbi:hypothetical protein VOLCADRAFT_106565 [Volvox carteri f. nagariensis]|uniref:Uncharacterized protein n=1 Tax=Volvox carteri f. nagariensis TaxID=3068 RepID=D8U878_VOLCA|nr:uncharacterized protein VOLCADRAFT_106565 [Volvox carteri f. nagariensis]EFJ44042.1 hypothetical protein VOLCADRAFT_106565 [Volvox carteri f. nagariensis]|eukprot:XP_002954843.1 hypothetical protein VOLCADRAFT_106565 [Volvox carteri f. nagariensis]
MYVTPTQGTPQDYLQTYVILPVDHTSRTPPLAVGVELTEGFVSKATKLPKLLNIPIPIGPTETFSYSAFEQPAAFFPMVGTNPFGFVYWSYAFNGHPGVGIYDVPHFDFHFMFPSYDYWWNQEWNVNSHGPCMGGSNATFFKTFKPIPSCCWPGSTLGPIIQAGDFVWGMGSHLWDTSAAEYNPVRRFNFTHIYGQYDGKIQFFESMVTVSTMQRPRGYQECITLTNNPRVMDEARHIPSRLCVVHSAKSILVEYRNFAPVLGGCTNTCGGQFAGSYPSTAPMLPPELCSVPA